MKKYFIVLPVFLLLLSCHDNCKINTMKCDQNMAMICNGDKDWEIVTDCDTVEPEDLNWTCCVDYDDVEEIHTCLPVGVCEELENDSN